MTARVGLIGTFDVANYGDLLFPIVAQRELTRRRPDLDFLWFGPVGAATPRWPTTLGLGPLDGRRLGRLAELCDAVILGGGDLVRGDGTSVAPSYGMTHGDATVWRPSAWFSSMPEISRRGRPVLWNAVGVAEPTDGSAANGATYVSVRDPVSAGNLSSAGEGAAIVPDSILLLDRLLPIHDLDDIREAMIEAGRLPESDYIVIQASSGVAPEVDLDAVDRLSAGRDIVVVEIGPCHGDAALVQLALERFGERVHAVSPPSLLEEIAATIAGAGCFVGNSLHGGITSLVFDVPFRLFQFDPYSKREGVLGVLGVEPTVLIRDQGSVPDLIDAPVPWDRHGAIAALDEHFDLIAGLLPVTSDAAELEWVDRPELVQLTLERPPRTLDLGTALSVTPAEPPRIDAPLADHLAPLEEARQRRATLPDISLPLLSEFGRTRLTPEDVADAVAEVRSLRFSFEEAADGWSQAVDSANTAHEGWREAVETAFDYERGWTAEAQKAARLERSIAGMDQQLVARTQCWLDDVSGPAVLRDDAVPLSSSEDYAVWQGARDVAGAPSSISGGIRFTLLTPVFDPPAALLESCIRSVRAQTYGNWELILVDVSDAPHVAPICERFASIDERIRVVTGPNLGISGNTNLAAEHAGGDWFALLDHDDELAPTALESIADAIGRNPDVGFGYTDEDKIDEQGHRFDPFFKPDWSPDLLRTLNYVTHLQVIRRDIWETIEGLRPEMDGAQDYDLALRASMLAGGAFHVPEILYHWRVHEASTAADVTVKPQAHHAGRRALEDFARVHEPDSWIEFGTGPTSHRFRYPIRSAPLSIIIPFRDNADLTGQCLAGIAGTSISVPFEVLLVDNQSQEPVTASRIQEWEERYPWVRVDRYDAPFNFQKINNWAVDQTDGEYILFLNNDTEPFHSGWVEALVEHAQRPEVGAVGARLFYPDGLVQHAGVTVGIGGYADHPWAGLRPERWTPAGPSYWTRNFLAVTAACLMIERAKFDEIGRFDERFVVGGGDVALGLALHDAGYWNVMTPYARLIHHESRSRGSHVAESDLPLSREVYAPFLAGRDPFYNPNLTLADTSCRLDIR